MNFKTIPMKLLKIKSKPLSRCLSVMLLLLLTYCVSIQTITQPASGIAGETVTIKVNAQIDVQEDLSGSRLIVGFLSPTSWKSATSTTMTYTSNAGNGGMSPVPADAKPVGSDVTWAEALNAKFGIGENYIKDVEWVVFQSDLTANVKDNQVIDVEVSITPTLGMQNLTTQLGYFVGSNKYNLNNADNYDIRFTECFSVINGDGQNLDYCSPQISTAEPTQALDNDFISLFFDENAITTQLSGADEVFVCATGYTQEGTAIDLCSAGKRLKMLSAGSNRWRVLLWPRQVFGLSEGQSLERIEYFFTNADGSTTVLNQGDTGVPFVYQFSCQ